MWMRWVGYGLQGVGGLMALTGLGIFTVGKLVERAAVGGNDDLVLDDAVVEVEVATVG
jgi:hypothetical protein